MLACSYCSLGLNTEYSWGQWELQTSSKLLDKVTFWLDGMRPVVIIQPTGNMNVSAKCSFSRCWEISLERSVDWTTRPLCFLLARRALGHCFKQVLFLSAHWKRSRYCVPGFYDPEHHFRPATFDLVTHRAPIVLFQLKKRPAIGVRNEGFFVMFSETDWTFWFDVNMTKDFWVTTVELKPSLFINYYVQMWIYCLT